MAAKKETKKREPVKRPAHLPLGRPPIIGTVEELEARIIAYIEERRTNNPWYLPTKAGLAFACGVDRHTLTEYEKRPEYAPVLKYWYALFEDTWVQNLSRPNATGTIFYLKNTYGYVDKNETDMTSAGKAIQYVVPKEIAEKHQIHFVEVEKEHAAAPETEGGRE